LLGSDADVLVRLRFQDTQCVVQRALVSPDESQDVVGVELVVIGESL
jgi:hypothetical protein